MNKVIKIGVWAHKKKINYDVLIGSDPEIVADFEASLDKPFE